MSEHTPEPWRAIYVGSGDWDLSGPTTQEDWKLAAAAPELLEALQYMLNVCPAIDAQGEEAHYQARAAIAKATGAPE